MDLRSVVLLKDGALEVVQCQSDAIFALARIRGSGICGVFTERWEAEEFVEHVNSTGADCVPLDGGGLPGVVKLE